MNTNYIQKLALALTLLSQPVWAGEISQADPFWQLYPNGGWTLYCGEHFNAQSKVGIEAVYSLDWISKFLKCDSVEQCQDSREQFRHISSDLHNLYPALPMIIQARHDDHFGTVNGEYREYFECDFERDGTDHIVEPRSIARGNIARSIFYMYNKYKLPIRQDKLDMLLEWNRVDPPSKDEMRRNDLIEQIQGNRNPYIDNSLLAEEIRTSTATKESEALTEETEALTKKAEALTETESETGALTQVDTEKPSDLMNTVNPISQSELNPTP